MAWAHYGDRDHILVHLADGHLPEKDVLERLAERSAEALRDSPGGKPFIPYSWEHWNIDSVYGSAASNVRPIFCHRQPPERVDHGWCEAWLFGPRRNWKRAFELNTEGEAPNRRFLVTLHQSCDYGLECVRNLVRKTRMDVVPREAYRDPAAFRREAESLLSYVSLPFFAPCECAAQRAEKKWYDVEAFGR
jgi:hypothetical protein